MFRNYLKIAFRNILKQKTTSFINIMGLAVGITACLLISLYIWNDFSFDKSNRNFDSIYRVCPQFSRDGSESTWSLTPTGYAQAFVNEFLGVKSVRLSKAENYTPVIKYDDRLFTVENFLFTDPSIFEIFDFPLIEGNPQKVLSEPNSIVITQTQARKIFGDIHPLGKTIRVNNLYDFKVTGIAKDTPANSSVQFNFLVPFTNLRDVFAKEYLWKNVSDEKIFNNFSSLSYYTFILLPDGTTLESIQKKLPAFLDKYLGTGTSEQMKLFLQPLGDIHFNVAIQFDFPNKGNKGSDYILGVIASFILLIACVNFVNISTARSSTRAKEIGLRKVLGADRIKIIWQFTSEFTALTFLAVIIAVLLTVLTLPYFNTLVEKHLTLSSLNSGKLILMFISAWILLIILTSAYPSFYYSSFKPIPIIRGVIKFGSKSGFVKKFLIVFQFAISAFLIVMAIAITKQYYFLKSHALGFDKEHVIFLPANTEINKNFDVFKSLVIQKAGINYVSKTNWIPGRPNCIETYSWSGKTERQSDSFYSLIVDPDYAPAIDLKFAKGRNFSREMFSDVDNSYILNETAARKMGFTPENVIGQQIKSQFRHNGHVIGVVKDFNFKSLHSQVEPVMMLMDSRAKYSDIIIKMSSQDISLTLNYIHETWEQLASNFPFDYHFLDQDFENLYSSEEKLNQIIALFSGLSIFIACLGLLGIVSHSIQERTKEIGVRKVLGSSVNGLVYLLTREYAALILVANLIAWPVAYYVMNNWLEDFAYRIEISWWVFVLSGLIALLIALATVSYQAIKAALANPSESLRYE